MDEKTAKELIKALKANTKTNEELAKLLRRSAKDPAQPKGTQKLKG